MTFYIRLQDDIAVEIVETDGDIKEMYSPELVWVVGSASVKSGQIYKNGVFSDIVEPVPVLSKEEAEVARLTAYAHPINGCDRYFSESISLQAEGYAPTSLEVKEARAKGLARKLEIQVLYPYPV